MNILDEWTKTGHTITLVLLEFMICEIVVYYQSPSVGGHTSLENSVDSSHQYKIKTSIKNNTKYCI